jgi:hypothetical protein
LISPATGLVSGGGGLPPDLLASVPQLKAVPPSRIVEEQFPMARARGPEFLPP